MGDVELFGAPAKPAWVPDESDRDRSRLLRAMRHRGFDDLRVFHEDAIMDPETFWRGVVEDLDIAFDPPFDRVLDESAGKPFPRWFVGGGINASHLCAHRHADGPLADKEAVVYEGDSGQRRALTFRKLDAEVRRFAANLHALGVQRGDRVILYVPVVPEATVAFLGCAMIGAITVPAFTGYGSDALATRVRDSEAVALVTADGTTRRGKEVPLKHTVDGAIDELGDDCTLTSVLVVRHLNNGAPMAEGRDIYFDQLDTDPTPIDTVVLGPNDPLCIVYTSGTTGRPKGIQHSHGGLAVKAALDFGYGFDVQEDDVIAWISDMGWLVGPLMIMGGLQLGATVVFTEGLPNYPEPTRLFDLIDSNRVTLQGVAPTAMRAVMATSADHDFGDLTSLRAFVSTGEAWDEPTWWWLYETVGRGERPIINYSGGTEVGGGLLVGYPFLPMEAAAFNGPLPGLDVAVLDAAGDAIVGEVGELAVRNTFPGMTHAFWQDEERYLDTYWRTWKDTWHHGDLASVDDHGTWRIHGRSDDTIKVSGRRIGPAELEASLLRDPKIVEAAVIGVPDERRGQSVTAFVVLGSSEGVDHEDLVATAEQNVGRSFAPVVHVVASLPKTKNGKIVRRAIRARHLGTPVGDTSSLDPLTPLEDIPVRAQTGDK